MILSHKIRLDPNNVQETYFRKAAGTSRFAYNWGLDQWKSRYESGETVTEASVRKTLTQLKKEDGYHWIGEVSSWVPKYAIKNLGLAFQNFFRRVRQGETPGYPKFKKRGVGDSFRIDNGGGIKVDGRRIKIPTLGWARMRESLRFEGRVVQAVVSRSGEHWYVSIAVDVGDAFGESQAKGIIGLDLGIKDTITGSHGRKLNSPKPLRKMLKKLKFLQRSLSRKVKGSKNYEKAKRKVNRLHRKIANIRLDFLHKTSTRIVRRWKDVVIEDLNVSGMLKNHKLARAISDESWSELRRQLTYKVKMTGSRLWVVDRFYPSSKLCSSCGEKSQFGLGTRNWTCDSCGSTHDRDVNAARNLKQMLSSNKWKTRFPKWEPILVP